MVSVARHDYATDGHQEYWPFLFARIRDAVFADPERFWNKALANQQHQPLLGRWFRHALDAFGYSIPEEGQKYVGPIVFHAGVPRASLHGVLEVLATACEPYGPQTIGLPIDIRSALIENHFPPLHRNGSQRGPRSVANEDGEIKGFTDRVAETPVRPGHW